jgi:hypothetical protein
MPEAAPAPDAPPPAPQGAEAENEELSFYAADMEIRKAMQAVTL